MKVLSAYYF